jgi:hypothetical protein
VILVEGAPVVVHERVAGPGLGDQHHHGVRQRIAAAHQELEGVVEAGGVGLALVGDRPDLGDVVAEELGIDRRLAGRHPVDVATQRVDLAVMGDHAVGMRELPGREGVGGEALVHERNGALEALVLQVGIVVPELAHEHHALVHDGARGQADGIVAGGAPVLHVVDGVGDDLAGQEQAALERLLVVHSLALADEDLAVQGLGRLHALAEVARIHRYVAPAQEVQALIRDGLADDLLDELEALRVARHEQVADAIFALLGQPDAELGAFGREEAVRDLDQDAAAVAHLRVCAHGAPVVEVEENLQALLDDAVGPAVLHVGDEADAAGILLMGRIVEPLGSGQSRIAPHLDRIRCGRAGRGFGSGALGGRVAHIRSSHPNTSSGCLRRF